MPPVEICLAVLIYEHCLINTSTRQLARIAEWTSWIIGYRDPFAVVRHAEIQIILPVFMDGIWREQQRGLHCSGAVSKFSFSATWSMLSSIFQMNGVGLLHSSGVLGRIWIVEPRNVISFQRCPVHFPVRQIGSGNVMVLFAAKYIRTFVEAAVDVEFPARHDMCLAVRNVHVQRQDWISGVVVFQHIFFLFSNVRLRPEQLAGLDRLSGFHRR